MNQRQAHRGVQSSHMVMTGLILQRNAALQRNGNFPVDRQARAGAVGCIANLKRLAWPRGQFSRNAWSAVTDGQGYLA